MPTLTSSLRREIDLNRIRLLSERYVLPDGTLGRIHHELLLKLEQLVAVRHPEMHWTYFIQQLQKMRQLEADLETAEDDHLRDELDHNHADAEQRLEQLQRQLSDLATREQRGELSDSELMDLLELESKVEAAESAVRSAKVACNSHKRSRTLTPQRRKQYFAIRHELFGEEIPTT
jgi:hypothetical protein